MTDASASPLPRTIPFGTVGIADGLAAYGLKALEGRHEEAISARGLDPDLLATLGVGASDLLGGDAIGIPYLDHEVVVAVKHRGLSEKKFTQPKGGKQILYNIDCLRDSTLDDQPIIITEGELDAIAAIQAGFPRTVSVPGGAPSTPAKEGSARYGFLDEAMALFDGCRAIILASDDDEPGRILRSDLAIRFGEERCKWVKYPDGCKDLNDALKKEGRAAVQHLIRSAKWMPMSDSYTLDEIPEPPLNPAYDTGIIGLNQHYNIRLGDFCVITGIPGHGKSSLINEICGRMAQARRWKTVFASFEQAPKHDHRRALRTFYAEKLEKHMSPDEKLRADKWINEHFAFVTPKREKDMTVAWLLEAFASRIKRDGSKIVVLDPWNELDHVRAPDQTLTEYVGIAIKQFKWFAAKYNVHVIVAAHPAKLRRTAEGKWPMPELYDISDSAHWANKPDVGIVVHREKMIGSETTINVLKTRYADIGRPGTIKGNWNVERTRYTITEDTR